MTGANILNLNSAEVGNVNTAAAVTNKNKSAVEEVAAVFASLMNQSAGGMQMSEPDHTDAVNPPEPAAASDSTQEAYDRYQYKQNTVERSENPSVSDKIDSAAEEELDEFEEDVIAVISEKLDVPAEEVQKALEELGLTVFDLLNPKNLAILTANLTDTADTMDLLMNADFQELLSDIGQMGNDLMSRLDIRADQIDELVMQMNPAEEPVIQTAQTEEPVIQSAQTEEPVLQADTADTPDMPEKAPANQEAAAVTQEETDGDVWNQPVVEEAYAGASKETEPPKEQKLVVEDLRETDGKEEAPTLVKAVEADEKKSSTGSAMDFSKSDNGSRMMSDGQQIMHQNVEQTLHSDSLSQPVSYTDIDVFDIIEQVAQNARVILETDVTTMEMQLNPENLGKIYLHISSKEGTVHAQIAAQNELVKEALEVQIATLRENLSRDGVKVDAVEVTIASHEFERNLEQNEQGQQQNPDEEKKMPRRNLKLDALDELSGLMSEEEALVARMMRDNGNSVDFTA